MTQDIPELGRKSICPHCRKLATQRLAGWAPYTASFWAPNGANIEEPGVKYMATCNECGQIILYDDPGESLSEADDYQSATICYPTMEWRHSSVPSVVREAYETAMQFQAGEPSAFVSRALNVLKSVCDDKGVDGQTLRDRIRRLSDRGEIPGVLANAAECLIFKVEGPALSAVQQIHGAHVELFDELVKAMIEHVYVVPAKFQDLADYANSLTTK